MPFYEYQCQACQERVEVLQKISDAPLRDCPACGKPALQKLISAAGFRLKGGGWYETDFKTGDKKKNVIDGGSASTEQSGTKSDGGGKKTDGGKSQSKAAVAS